jgi:hypothetical protein
MTPNTVEILFNFVNAISTSEIRGITPVNLFKDHPVTPAKTEQFVGVWDMAELITTYSRDIAFHSLPIGMSLTHSLAYSLTHLLTHSLTHSLIRILTYSLRQATSFL